MRGKDCEGSGGIVSNEEVIARLESIVAELEKRQSIKTSFKTMLAIEKIKKAIFWLKALDEWME